MSTQTNRRISLNFFPLKESSFNFQIWRKPFVQNSDEKFRGYRTWLPDAPSNKKEKSQYEVAFEEEDGFEKFECHSKDNISLTKRYLLTLLKRRVNSEVDPKFVFLSNDRFQDRVFLKIGSHKLGEEVVWLESYFLESKQSFGFLVDYAFKVAHDAPFSKDVQRLSLSLDSSYRSNKNFYIDRFNKVQKYIAAFHSKLRNLSSEIVVSNDLQQMSPNFLQSKVYVFGDEKSDNSQFVGINKNGPLRGIEGDLHIPILFENKDAYYIDKFLSALQGKSFATFKGIAEVFRADVKFYKNRFDKITTESVETVIQKAHDFREKKNLVVPIVVLDSDEDERYYDLKFSFLREKVPMQAVTRGLIANENSLKWSISNIGLQIFAKAGGVPWKVKPSNQKAVIFGIGQAHHFEDGSIRKYFSYSVCTDSSGLYQRVNVLGNSSDEHSYLDQLRDNIAAVVSAPEFEEMQQIVLHVPFKIKVKELEIISQAISDTANSRSDHEFVVLKVNQDNKFFGYADTNSLVPYESSYLHLLNKPIW